MVEGSKFDCPVCNKKISKDKIEWTTELTKGGIIRLPDRARNKFNRIL